MNTLSYLSKEFEVVFEFYVNRLLSNWTSLLHMTIGGNRFEIGNRIPAIFMLDSQLYVAMALNGSGDTGYFGNNISTNQWYGLSISQRKNSEGDYMFEVMLDGSIVYSVVNQATQEFENVKIYVSDPWYTAFEGRLKNIRVCSAGKNIIFQQMRR